MTPEHERWNELHDEMNRLVKDNDRLRAEIRGTVNLYNAQVETSQKYYTENVKLREALESVNAALTVERARDVANKALGR